MEKYLAFMLLLTLLIVSGGCERPPKYRVAEVDISRLVEVSEAAGKLQAEAERRGSELEDYYRQLDLAGPETEDQAEVYRQYEEEIEEYQQRLYDKIEEALSRLEEENEYDAVISAESAYIVQDDITEEVAEKIDNLNSEED